MVEKDKGMWLAEVREFPFHGEPTALYMVIEADNRQDAEGKFKSGLYGDLLDKVVWTPPYEGVHAIAILFSRKQVIIKEE